MFRIFSPRPANCSLKFVADWIEPVSKTWRVDLLNSFLSPVEVDLIRSIPLSLRDVADQFIWHHEKEAIFSVKTAYHVTREWVRLSAQHGSSSSSPYPFSELWSEVWHANVTPKVRVSFWRLCTESLPTRRNLGLKHITTDLLCVLCNSFVE